MRPPHAENKLEKNEEAALLSWEIYLKENYLQNQQYQQKQRTEQKIQDISNRYGRPFGSETYRAHGPPGGGPATGHLGRETSVSWPEQFYQHWTSVLQLTHSPLSGSWEGHVLWAGLTLKSRGGVGWRRGRWARRRPAGGLEGGQ